MRFSQILLAVLALPVAQVTASAVDLSHSRKTCTVIPHPNGGDSAPAIISAFKQCGQGGTVAFKNETYYVNSVMNTTGLKDCTIELKGTLLWSADFDYWIAHSLPVGYQNQSSAWIFGGERVHFNGYGYGTINGNGQKWYDWAKGAPNIKGRPHAITIWNTKDSLFEGIRFLKSQMWTMTVIHSDGVVLRDIDVDNSCSSKASNINTDGADTVYANNITFERWTVRNGDDSISFKANSTNIYVNNCTFYDGIGFALGSIGQYEGQYETLENIYASNIVFHNTQHAAYIKTWTGVSSGYPPNGGGGGLGKASNLTFTDFVLDRTTDTVFAITQCIYSGTGGCNSSKFKISDVKVKNVKGTQKKDGVAVLQCSGDAPCTDIEIEDIDVKLSNGTKAGGYLCDNIKGSKGFKCTGHTCGSSSNAGTC